MLSPYVVIGSPFLAAESGSGFTAPDFTAVVNALNISPSNVLTVLASGIGICLALCFAWWGARKLSRMFMSAFKRGKLRL